VAYPTKPVKIILNLINSCIKRLLSDGFNIAAIQNSLPKSRSPRCQACSDSNNILLGNFFGLIKFVNLPTTSFIQRILTVFFIFFIKTLF